MNKTKISVATFASILGIAGIEHGIGEILQGKIKPGTFIIQSWPNHELYEVLAGEPAFTILIGMPIYVTGIIAILVSALIIIFALFFVEKKYIIYIFPGLVLSLFLFGGGIAGPVLIGILLSFAIYCIIFDVLLFKKERPSWKVLKSIWKIFYPLSIISWFSLWPGLVLLGAAGFIPDFLIVYILSSISIITFILTIFSALSSDNLEYIKL
ncbi:MAG: hypothetical protein ACLFVR_04945 [Thiohalospira sp.]